MNQSTVSLRKVRVVFETTTGDFRSRRIEVSQQLGDSEQTLMSRASEEYRRRFGINRRIVAIHLN